MKDAIGILGGMGPLASQLFYGMIIEKTAASCDQDHVDLMILSHASMPDRTEAIAGGATEEVCVLLSDDCRLLEQAGCKAVAAACNTVHYFLHRIEPSLNIPLISMIREAADAVAARMPGQCIAILSTQGTIQSDLYQHALAERGMQFWVPDPNTQAIVTHVIYDCVKAGIQPDRQTLSALAESVRSAGCSSALLACTELSVIARDWETDIVCVDPMEILAKRVIEIAGKKLKSG